MSCWTSFQGMCKKIICPSRHANFNQHDMISRRFRREVPPYELFFVPGTNERLISVLTIIFDSQNLPTVLYLHGNGGHKMEALQITDSRINLVSLDFAACGKSQGEFLTYGEAQARDVAAVVEELKRRYGIRKINIWGRSMGASIGIMYASLYPRDVERLILDTPFRWLKEVVRNVAKINNSSMPHFIIDIGLSFVQNKLTDIVGHNIFATDFKMYLNLLQTPALFISSNADAVVSEEDVKQLYLAYKGYKELRMISCLHHEDRPKDMIAEGLGFILNEEGARSTRSSTLGSLKRGISMSLRGQLRPQ